MFDSKVKPTDVRLSRLRPVNWELRPQQFPTYRVALGAFANGTAEDMRLAEVLLTGLNTLSNGEDAHRNLITRVELLWDGKEAPRQQRGAVLFTQFGAQLHFVHALIGYSGTAYALTEVIFDLLGATTTLTEINNAIGDRAYHVIVSREATSVIEGVTTALPYSQPLPEWKWWWPNG